MVSLIDSLPDEIIIYIIYRIKSSRDIKSFIRLYRNNLEDDYEVHACLEKVVLQELLDASTIEEFKNILESNEAFKNLKDHSEVGWKSLHLIIKEIPREIGNLQN